MSTTTTDANFNIDTFLRVESTSFNQDREAERILGLATKASNPLEVLELDAKPWLFGKLEEKDIKVTYRKKSLLLHPDKCKHPRAQDAFEMLKKAESELMEEGKRNWLLGLVGECVVFVGCEGGGLQTKNLIKPTATSTANAVIPDEQKNPQEFNVLVAAVKVETRRLLMDQGQRDNIRLKNERKRKLENDKKWEEGRETRINDWRKFVKKSDSAGKKKRKTDGPELLG
ncbi:hypothetical protein BCR33DRAFT_720494 [Rhizoclosmatium globosum]|uniref:J domain-containing protein n=1 Tax=Rhizoclosmatium globosum TaxID=329046 RepID=A0A1Y2BVM8_9FUNG|nr:hypothetical protein BCR33DRAFT_720494 [Rhizoclosmatium globosum]|eukprot:ORY38821.1 hypothetical protein BCR33DRAFT_720494 [Rhizoclosmatium globosum]